MMGRPTKVDLWKCPKCKRWVNVRIMRCPHQYGSGACGTERNIALAETKTLELPIPAGLDDMVGRVCKMTAELGHELYYGLNLNCVLLEMSAEDGGELLQKMMELIARARETRAERAKQRGSKAEED